MLQEDNYPPNSYSISIENNLFINGKNVASYEIFGNHNGILFLIPIVKKYENKTEEETIEFYTDCIESEIDMLFKETKDGEMFP